ncbi:endonuclease/exonuclease/phosphatase family protein [Haloactinomyces albus]|uniref:Extracellular nuclease n=1 Tax=Haloactinomyces albus TaxID=1352928 RepID=A0AAE3ZFP7_9ACTN|nr:endonuclease/exonuclease/phosphatase family protein [Haloactinomyces albus]MDR7304098.1 putative extracellular nuclease [Haloactinomyces albus]
MKPTLPSWRVRLRRTLATGALLSTASLSLVTLNPAAATAATCGDTATRIRDIQGTRHLSSLDGSEVTDVRGVVTAVGANGFWYQDPCPDADPATSEGLFVHTSHEPAVQVGDVVAVSGTVSEYRPGGTSTANLTTTELTSPSVTTLGTATVPAPTVLGDGGRIPPGTVIDDDATGSVEKSGTFDATDDGIDFYESMEGMRVRLDNAVATGPTNSYGEIPVLGDDGANASVRTTRGGIVLRQSDPNPERLLLDDKVVSGSTPTVNTGDHFSAPATGVLGYSFGNFKLQLTRPLSGVSESLPRETTESPTSEQLAVATMNVANLDAKDPQSTFDALAGQIVSHLAAPGIIALQEVQDNNGAENGPSDADRTWSRLIDAIGDAGGPTYDYRQIDPVNGESGGEPGGNIRVGFLFRTDRVSFAPGPHGDATTAVQVSDSGTSGDRVSLSLNPGRIDPGNPAFDNSRKPLIGKFHFDDEPVFVIANHFTSKGGDDPLFGRYQPPKRPSATKRTAQARIVADFYDKIEAIDPNARVIVAGDLNAFTFSPTLDALTEAGLTDLPATLPASDRYTYLYQGNSQVLDHLLVSPSLESAGYEFDIVHTNAEFATRPTDHDPQVVRLNLP